VCQNQNFIAEKTLDIDISLALLIYKLEGWGPQRLTELLICKASK
jgi:hypothetical protein